MTSCDPALAAFNVSTDYDAIRYRPGFYWARGHTRFMNQERWYLTRVSKPCWTKESGKDHCQWYYNDGSGGYEIDRGEWIYIDDPNDNAA